MAELNIIVRAQNQASGVLNGLKRDLQSFNNQAQSVGTALSLGVTAPFTLLAKTGLETVAEFSRTMSELEVVTGASGDAWATLNDTAIKLGAETSFSANEAAQAMLELSKASMDTEDVLSSIPGVLALAAAGSVDLGYAANLTASSLNAFQLSADQSGYVANLLAAAANESSANISDLAAGLQQGGFAFSAANQDIDDLAASLAILTNVGLTGSDAGTALKNAFTRIMSPTKEAKKLMDSLNLSFYNANGEMKPMEFIIGDLNTALGGMTQQQRNATLETLFLSDGMKAMIPLLTLGQDGFLEMKDAVNQAGAAQEVADAKMRGLAGAFEYASGSIESALLNVFGPLEGVFVDIIKAGADFITWISQLPRPVLNAALAFVAVLAAAGPLLLALPLITGFISAMLSPIGLVVLAVAGLAAAWASNFGDIQGKTEAVLNALQPLFNRLAEYLDMAKKGDWGGLTKAVFSDVSDVLSKASATIAAFDWADWIDGVLDWAMYIARFLWSAYITGLKWEAYIGKVLWGSFINALVWTADIVGSVDWTAFIANLTAWGDYIEELTWSTFISALTWGTKYIKSLDWKGFVATLTDWGEWIASLDWTKIITTAIDWATWIPALIWNVFVKAIDWSTFILGFLWTEYISKIDWGKFITSVLSWGDYASEIDWGEWISGALDWAAYIGAFTWNSFVSKLEWPVIAQFAWREWISKLRWPSLPTFDWSNWVNSFNWPSLPSFSWGNWISSFNWPSLPSFSWSSWIGSFSWPSLPSFSWSSFIPSFSWPSIPSFPGWGSIFGGGGGANAAGTPYFRGGLTTINERGTELLALPGRNRNVWLPRGTSIIPAERVPMMAGAGGGVTVNLYATINNDMDAESIAWQVAAVLRRNQR